MKRIITLIAALAFLAFQSCERYEPSYSYSVTTLEATRVTHEGYAFNAEIEWWGNASTVAYAGVFYSHRPDVTMGNVRPDDYIYTTPRKEIRNRTLNINSYQDNFTRESGHKLYYYHTGETVYYRAYIEVSDYGVNPPKHRIYYGEEKSFVIPE